MVSENGVFELAELSPYGSFPVGNFRKERLSAHRIHFVTTNSNGEGGGAVYAVGRNNYFVSCVYTPVSGKGPAHLDYYLDRTQEISGVPSTLWNEQPSGTQPVDYELVLDALEKFIIANHYPEAGHSTIIHRDDEIYEVTPYGKSWVAQPEVA
jgi:hypothetical protein